MPQCHICSNQIKPFMSFGKMPIANGFLPKESISKEYFFELEVAHCSHCNSVQVPQQPTKEQMFHTEYPFFSGSSRAMEAHFSEFANSVSKRFLKDKEDPFVVEIGCNDGILIQHVKNLGLRHLGIDPSANVAKLARNKGIDVMSVFFDPLVAQEIVQIHGQSDLFLAANVMCHLPNICSIVEGIHTLLSPTGVLVFEEPYLGDVIETTAYDQIYDEHVFLFSVQSVSYLFDQFNMQVIDVAPQPTHGGSMRYTIAHKDQYPVSPEVNRQLEKEILLGLSEHQTFVDFRKSCENSRKELVSVLQRITNDGKTVVGYAATSKSTTILNYCGIDSSLVSYICDTTPIKHGKLSPGMHIPIKRHTDFSQPYPDYALLFAYNHQKEIFAKETEFSVHGGKWILYVPKVSIL